MSLGRLDRFTLLERIGSGATGIVFRGWDPSLEREVALKVLASALAIDPVQRARLLRGARAEARLVHTNIAACHEIGEAVPDPPGLLAHDARDGALPYVAMEFVPGEDLDAHMHGRPLPLREALAIAAQIAAGLEAAHARGVVHRDLKPGNVRVREDGVVKICDFGLAHLGPDPRAAPDAPTLIVDRSVPGFVGTVLYMAPEQASGGVVDARSDLFSLGVVMYEMVTGHRPFGGADLASALHAIAEQEPPPLAAFADGVPAPLQALVTRLLAKHPRDRCASAAEVREAIEALRTRDAPVPRAARPRRPRSRVLAGLAGAALLVAAFAWWSLEGRIPLGHATPSLAVLGFENLSGDSAVAALGAGLAADLAGELVQAHHVNVSPEVDVLHLPAAERTPQGAARRLGVSAVLTGTLRRSGDAGRLQAQLVDGHTGFVTWSASYALAPATAYAVKQQLAVALAGALGRPALARGAAGAVPAPPADAYASYLRGLQALADLDDPGARERADEAFARATELAPAFALAWAGRARALAWRYDHEKRPALLAEADACVARALVLAPELGPARLARARVQRARGQFAPAIADLDAMTRANPADDDAWVTLASVRAQAGDVAGADTCLLRAVVLRPASVPAWRALANLRLRSGRYAAAREAFARVIALEPGQNAGWVGLASADLMEGRFAEAAAAFRRLPRQVTSAALASNMATAFYFSGRLDEALGAARLAVALEPKNSTLRANLGDCLRRLKRADEAHAEYAGAVALDMADLRVAPHDPRALALAVLHLAQSGACERAWSTYRTHRTLMPDRDVEVQRCLAKAFALCGRRDEAVAALRCMAAQGATTDLLRAEDEFASLRSDSGFRALFPPAPQVPAPPTDRPR